MISHSFLKIGDRIQVLFDGRWYATMVERLEGEDEILISTPWSCLRMARLEDGCTYTFRSTNPRGLYEFDCLMVREEPGDQIPLYRSQIASELRRIQRRRAYRQEVSVDVHITECKPRSDTQPESYWTKTKNLSENGMLFYSARQYSPGDGLRCRILLGLFGFDDEVFDLRAEVIRLAFPDEGQRYMIGAVFPDISSRDKRLIGKFVARCQREGML